MKRRNKKYNPEKHADNFGRYELEMVDCNVPLMGGFHS